MEGLLANDRGPICKLSQGDLWAVCGLQVEIIKF